MTFITDIRSRVDAIDNRRDELIEITNDGKMTGREIAEGLELFARMDDIHDEIVEAVYDGRVKFNPEITVSLDGTKIKFPDIDSAAEWMADYVK